MAQGFIQLVAGRAGRAGVAKFAKPIDPTPTPAGPRRTFHGDAELYADDERRRFSGEIDFGVNWSVGRSGGRRVTLIRATGEIYVKDGWTGFIEIVGQVERGPDHRGVGVPILPDHPGEAHAEQLLEGWAEKMYGFDTVRWVRERLADTLPTAS